MNPSILNNSDLLCSVSSNGDCVALCTPDGVIKFYDTLTSNLKLEYSSSTHLQAGCSCLAWSTLKRQTNPTTNTNTKQKKQKTTTADTNNSLQNELNDLDLIAIGTSQGAILLYSLSKASLHTQLVDGGHSDKVNDICWCPSLSDSLYSCSDDGYIIEWSLLDSKVKSKWKASKTAVTSISIDPTSKYLVCSSKTITVWDLKTKTKAKSLTGHSNDIFKLAFLAESSYFFSAASNDRILNAWSLDLEASNNTSVQSFTINDGPTFMQVLNLKNGKNSKALVLALTQKGQLFMYNHDLEEKVVKGTSLKKPIKAQNSLKMETKEGSPLKIYAAFVTNSQNERLDLVNVGQSENLCELLAENYLYVVYGSHLNPKIEKLVFSDLTEAKTVLKRDDPYKITISLQTQVTKTETPLISKELKVLVPGYMGPQSNNQISVNTKRKSVEPNQMTLEERLNVMGLDSGAAENGEVYFKNGQVPKTDNLLVLLVQGLQSNDAKMLNHVLQHKNDKVITKTVRILPTSYIIQLIKELNKRLQGHAQSGLGLIKWLKSVLMIHTSYLMSYPDLIESLGSVYEMMNARTKLFPQLSKLQGKLQLVMSQVTSQAEGLPVGNEKEPLLYYQDSTSEDEQIEDELIPSHSEFDEYVFSDEEDEEDEEEQEDHDENMLEDGDSKKNRKESEEEDEVEDEEEEEERDGFGFGLNAENGQDEDEEDEEDDE